MTGYSPLGSAVHAPALNTQAAPAFEACRRGLGLMSSLLIRRPQASSLEPEAKGQAAVLPRPLVMMAQNEECYQQIAAGSRRRQAGEEIPGGLNGKTEKEGELGDSVPTLGKTQIPTLAPSGI